MNNLDELADRRYANYRAHFEGCPDCSGSPEGECARAKELYRSYQDVGHLVRM